jgi:hypothetical protein
MGELAREPLLWPRLTSAPESYAAWMDTQMSSLMGDTEAVRHEGEFLNAGR